MVSAVVTNKIAAIYIGPVGVALVGQFLNFISITNVLAMGGLTSSITKYGAQYKDNKEILRKVLGGATLIISIASIMATVFVVFTCIPISRFLFHDESYAPLIVIAGMVIIPATFNTVCISIWNAFHEIKTMVIVNVIGSILAVFLAVALVIPFQVKGAVLVFITSQLLLSLVSFFFLKKQKIIDLSMLIPCIHSGFLKKHFKFSAMALSSLIMGMGVQFFIRRYIAEGLSYTDAGMWQGMIRISDMYLLIITTPLSVYYVPKLATLHTQKELRKEIFAGYKLTIPVVAFSCITIWFLRKLIISVLYSSEFAPMESLFLFQMIGDSFKICSWMLATLTIAKAMTRVFIILELLFGVLKILLNITCIDKLGVEGAVLAHMLLYLIHFIVMLMIFRDIVFLRKDI